MKVGKNSSKNKTKQIIIMSNNKTMTHKSIKLYLILINFFTILTILKTSIINLNGLKIF